MSESAARARLGQYAYFDAESRFRAIFEHAPVGQVFTGMDGRMTVANDELASLLGYRVAELVGSRTIELVAPADRPAAEADARALRAGQVGKISSIRHLRHRDGREILVRLISTMLPAADGTPQWWVSIVVDLTAEERTRAQLEHAHSIASAAAERLRLLHSVATTANDADRLDQLAPAVLESTCEAFAWAGGALVQWTDAGPTIRARYGSGVDLADCDLEPPAGGATTTVHCREHALVFVPLSTPTAARMALVFTCPDATSCPRDILNLVAAMCSRVLERETAERSLRESEAWFRAVFDSSPFPMSLVVAETSTFVAVNQALCRLLGRSREDLVGHRVTEFLRPEDIARAGPAAAAAEAAPDGQCTTEFQLVHASGSVVVTETTLAWLDQPTGRPLLLAQLLDVTARRAAEEALRAQAETDGLTGLPNRFGLVRALGALGPDGSGCAILCIGLDGFKVINSARGHEVGDEVLAEVAGRLNAVAGPHDLVARYGGDEFVLVCRTGAGELGGAAEPAEAARQLADRVENTLSAAIVTSTGPLYLSASVGLCDGSIAPGSPLNLLQRADTAMYQAKRAGKDRRIVYDSRLHQQAAEHRRIEHLLRNALDERRFVVHYQPVVDIADARVVAVEALVRLRDQDGQLVPPQSFIDVAERSGLIVPMGKWVLIESCAEIAALSRELGQPLGVSVNVAARQAARPDLAESVDAALTASGLEPGALTLELTESALLDADEQTLRQLTALRERGVLIGLDDFGTGYSSLTYLRRLPASHIKVDRSFVAGMTSDQGDAAIVRAVIGLAGDSGLFWVAEGVETGGQWRALQRLGPGFGQGYLFAPPMPAAELADVLRTGRPLAAP